MLHRCDNNTITAYLNLLATFLKNNLAHRVRESTLLGGKEKNQDLPQERNCGKTLIF